jgi:hypothetical protein
MKAHAPVEYDKATAHAIKAMREGTASASQQKHGMQWIEYVVCDVEGMSFHDNAEGGDRASAFHEGRRFVGNQIRKMSNPITLAALEAKAAKAAPKTSPRSERQSE